MHERLIIAVIGMAVFLIGLAAAASSCVGYDVTPTAQAWATRMGMNPVGLECVTHDTDGDGYYSCTVLTASGRVQEIECAGGHLNLNSGCRVPKLRIPRSHNP